jgi:Asparagine synthase
MAGLYVILGGPNPHRIQAAVERLTFFPNEVTITFNESFGSIAWVSQDDPTLFGPADHLQTGVRVVTAGRIAWDEADWQRAEGLAGYQGGLSNRLILEQYLQGGVAAVECHNGSAALLIWDPRDQCLHLFTDQLGFHPVFLYRPQTIDHCIIATFPDAIADDPSVETTPDYVSMAEFLKEWQATPPHTYYNEIKYAGAATHWHWPLAKGTGRCRQYWQPFQAGFEDNLDYAVEQLSTAVQQAVHRRSLPRLGPVAVYISGGLDSRVVPFTVADRRQTYGINLYDVPNPEAAIAEQICAAAGVRYIGFAREQDYYPRWMEQGVKISGAMWSVEDNHFLGTKDLLQQLGIKTVITALPADDLFKGDSLDRSYWQVLGANLPLFQFEPIWSRGFGLESPPRSTPPEFADAINQRLQEWFGDLPDMLTSDQQRLQVEDKRVRPICYVPATPEAMMFRAFPYDSFFADRSIAECYSRTPARWKLNSMLWGRVVAQLTDRNIIDVNRGWKPGASWAEKFWVYTWQRLKRSLKAATLSQSKGLATEGSWPNLGWYITHSPVLHAIWEGASPDDRALVTSLWGSDPWQLSLEAWTQPPVLNSGGLCHGQASPYALFRLLTLLIYLKNRRNLSVPPPSPDYN